MAPRKKPKIVYIDDSPEEPVVVERAIVPAAVEEPPVAPSIRPPKPSGKLRRPSLVLSLIFAFIAISVCGAFIFIPVKPPVEKPIVEVARPVVAQPIKCLGITPHLDWGYAGQDLVCDSGIVEVGQNIGDLLLGRNVDYRQVLQLMEIADKKEMPALRPGFNYRVLYASTDPQRPLIFVYEPDPTSFIFMNLGGPPAVFMQGRAVLRQRNRAHNIVVKTTLAEEMYNKVHSGLLLSRKLEAAVKWKVDLFHLGPGDHFLMLYEETEYEGQIVEVGDLLAVSYRQNGEDGYAFSYSDSLGSGYYDYEGRPMKSGFLMAPLEYSRISSPYDSFRVDPVKHTGEIRAHLGTDYAAPEGTPILAVGDGTVLNAENKGGNGNYVKLFHTDSIQTQYLHMSAFADGIVPGAAVRQGQVIGYVGTTGRSTGPHVCFRYWKNGLQVDHRKEKNFGGGGLKGDALQRFFHRRDSLLDMMTDA